MCGMTLFIINSLLLLLTTKPQYYLHAVANLLVEVDATLLLLLGTYWGIITMPIKTVTCLVTASEAEYLREIEVKMVNYFLAESKSFRDNIQHHQKQIYSE